MTQLERECRSYTSYLIGQAPTAYILEKYLDYHKNASAVNSGDRFDRLLVSMSARGPLWARLADSYGSVWRKNSPLRGKLVLSLALLECGQPGFQELRAPARSLPGVVFRLGMNAANYACSLAVSSVVFAPMNLWMAARER